MSAPYDCIHSHAAKEEIEIRKEIFDMDDKVFERRKRAQEILDCMTLEEKVSLCSGEDCWNTKELKSVGLESIMMSDGPHGLRKQIGATDNLGIGESLPAVCFPTASALACSFDRALLYEVGKAIGEECVQEGVSVLLGPGANQKRSPLCGRNFEYFSEDPIVSGELAAHMIQGIQSTGTMASLKHFAVNNQEKRRMSVDAIIDERTLRETYLKSFEIAVKKGKPDTVMCAYNRVNGTYCSENTYLLTDILRKEWGYEGCVISDWGAVHDRVLGVEAGLSIEMPGNHGYNDKKVKGAVVEGKLGEGALDLVLLPAIEMIQKGMEQKRRTRKDEETKELKMERHHELAVLAAKQSMVLAKNEDHILPGNRLQKAAILGAFAKEPRFQGAGSSKIHPFKVDTPWDAFVQKGAAVSYAPGYTMLPKSSEKEEIKLRKEAVALARGKDIVYIFAGLLEGFESEGFDRFDMKLPAAHNQLIEEVVKVNQNVVVIVIGGAPVEIPWVDQVKALFLAYLSGEGMGRAICDLLLGDSVPCGKLAETWPIELSDTPAYYNFPGGNRTCEYREGIFVGYRYYEFAGINVRFPFGHGLSYTEFSYSKLSLNKKVCCSKDTLEIHFTITNIGEQRGRETVFLFVANEENRIPHPGKELREFVKVELEPMEDKEVTIKLDMESLGFYDSKSHDWYAATGNYQIILASSLAQPVLVETFFLQSEERNIVDYRRLTPGYFDPRKIQTIKKEEFAVIYDRPLSEQERRYRRPYTKENTLEDVRHTLIGKIVLWYANHVMREASKAEEEQEGMMSSMIREMPFFAMVASGEDMISESMMEGILALLNGHYIQGIRTLLRR
ncbi:MAG: beta-glucosidase [Clostridiales bacterium]|nr:beta-glucosidase [Clostridiales bacterium]